MNIYFYILGGIIGMLGVLSYFFPRLATSKAVEAEFTGREKEKRKYLLHVSAHLFFTGAAVFLAGLPEEDLKVPVVLPEEDLKVPVVLPVLAVIFISMLLGNKRHLGRWFARRF